MASYGKNFDFRVAPEAAQRAGRYAVPTTGSPLPIGSPVEIDTAASTTALGLQPLKAAVDATTRGTGTPPAGVGILVYEYAPAAYAGHDGLLTTYSDMDTVPLGAAAQMVHGNGGCKVLLKNVAATTFLGTRSYAARKMVAGLGGATPTIAVGDYLEPYGASASDTNGYWKETSTVANAWLRVLEVDNDRAECVCELII